MSRRAWSIRTGAMQDLEYELPRISIVGDPFSPFCRALRQAVTYRIAPVLSS